MRKNKSLNYSRRIAIFGTGGFIGSVIPTGGEIHLIGVICLSIALLAITFNMSVRGDEL